MSAPKTAFVVYALVVKLDSPAGDIWHWLDVFHTRKDAVLAKGNEFTPEFAKTIRVRRATLTLFEK